MKHLELGMAAELSLGYQWKCKTCGEELRSERSADTGWKTWYFTKSGKRHFKSGCNVKNNTSVVNGKKTKCADCVRLSTPKGKQCFTLSRVLKEKVGDKGLPFVPEFVIPVLEELGETCARFKLREEVEKGD